MMKKIILTVLCALTVVIPAIAASQNTELKGKVVDENGTPFPFVNVVLMQIPDSTMLAGTTTDEQGMFILQGGDSRNAVVMAAMVGYKTLFVDCSSCSLIRMEPALELIGEAVVSAVMPKTKLTDQGIQTSVRGSVLETVGTAKDALERVPGLVKGQNGVEVLGKGAPLVYINGRRVTDGTELDRLQSNEIQSVEVISNPGSQYSAAVRAVVRIKTIKHQGDGFSFNTGISDEQSLRSSYNDPSGYFNANVRHNGLDVFAGVNALKFTSRQQSDMLQQTFGAPGFRQEGTLDFVQKMNNIGLETGFNLQLSDNHSLGAKIEASADPRIDVNQLIDEDVYRGDILIDRLLSEGHHTNDDMPSYLRANVYYNGTAGHLGIDFNADYYGLKTSQDAHTIEKSEMGQDDNVDYISHSLSNMFASKLVLSYPVWQGSLQGGTEEVFTRRSDDYSINTESVPSSKAGVSEDNVALFVSYGFYATKFGQLSAGMRYEHVNYEYNDLMGSDDIGRTYDNVFPTVSYANAFGPVQLQFSYSAKTTRPNFESLNSAIRYHSRYILQSGNSKLQPQTSHDLGLNLNWKFLTMVTQYSKIDDGISSWSELYNDEGIVIVHPVNLDRPVRTLAWFVNAAPTIGIWTVNYTAGVQQQWLTLNYPDVREASGIREVSFSDRPMWIVQLNNYLIFKNNWRLDFGAEYHSKAYSQNAYMTNNFLDLGLAVQKTFFNNSLVLRLEGTDLAGLANYDLMTDCGSHIIKQTNIMDSKRVKFSIRYNFNTANSKYKGTGAGSDVVKRMGK